MEYLFFLREVLIQDSSLLGLVGLITPLNVVSEILYDGFSMVSVFGDSSVNTVVLRDDGTTFGASTDGAGLLAWLDASGVPIAAERVVVLGAGAAARSIVDALGRSGAHEIVVVNRTAESAERAASLASTARVGDAADIGDARVVVNATSVGMGSEECPIDPASIHEGHAVADIVYHPLDTTLLRAARSAGAQPIDGLGMLVHQAVLQQELWTGRRPDPEVLRAAAEAELAARTR